MTNCGAGPGVRADGERERAADRVAVDRDHAPVDEVPALAELLRAGRRAWSGRRRARAAGRPSPGCPAASVTETTAKRGSTGSLIGQHDLGRRAVHDARSRRDGAHERGVRPRGRGQRERHSPRPPRWQRRRLTPALAPLRPLPQRDRSADEREHDRDHARIARSIASVELPPPPSESSPRSRRRRVRALGPVQSTTVPSE